MSTPMPLTTAMTYQDLAGYIEDHGPVEVVFHEGVENLESYPEAGIRGRIVGIRYDNYGQEEKPEDQVLKVQIHYDGYEVQNSLFESSNYVDRMSRFRLRAAPSGFYKQREELYVMALDLLESHMESIKPMPPLPDHAQIVEALHAMGLLSPP